MDPNPAPGEPATPPVETPQITPPASEGVKDPGEQQVPYTRFQEVNERAKQAEEEAQRFKEENERLMSRTQEPSGTDELDPDVEKMLDGYAKKRGLVSKDELQAQEMNQQVKRDVQTLETTPPVAGIPYDHRAITEFAQANSIPLTSKAALEATYRQMNWDKIMDATRNGAVEAYRSSGSQGAERPGSQGAQPPADAEVKGRNPKERIQSRITLARQKNNI